MSWKRLYAGYDDDTLATLASVGLLRRAAKDVEAGKVNWISDSEAGGVLGADGQCVTLDAGGVPKARCDCPASGVCKHILGAVLLLRQAGAEDPAAADAAAPDVLAEVLALDLTALFKSVGKPALRSAAALFGTVKNPPAARAVPGGLQIEVPDLPLSVRYMAGGSLAGMVSETAERTREAAHLAALLLVWQGHGQAIAWPAGISPAPPPPTEETGLDEGSRYFIDAVETLLAELIAQGLAHISPLSVERLQALNMSARAEGLPRLAGLLRELASLIGRLAAHDVAADTGDALHLLARIQAWCEAARPASGERLAALRGRLARDYEAAAAGIDLLPLGAWWWQTGSGARGLTLALWEPASGQIRHAVQARGNDLDPSFGAVQAWRLNSLWPGSGSVETVCKASLHLEQPRLSEDGRLALAGNGVARRMPPWPVDDPRLSGLGFTDWRALSAALAATVGLLGRTLTSVVLRPRAIQPMFLDEIGQRMVLTLIDAAGKPLALSLPCDPAHNEAIRGLEHALTRHKEVFAVLAAVTLAAEGPSLAPAGLLVVQEGVLITLSLGFIPVPDKAALPMAERMLRLLGARQAGAPPPIAAGFTHRLIAPVAALLEAMAATGRCQLDRERRAILGRQAAMAAGAGLDLLADAFTAASAHEVMPPGRLLRLSYLLQLSLAISAGM